MAPTTVIGTVDDRRSPPRRRRNAEVRAREYLTDGEVARLIAAAGENRHGHRDATMVLVAYRHGLRAAELVTLRWDAIDFAHGRLHVQPRSRAAPSRSIRCPAASCGRCAGLSASRTRRRRLSSRPSAARRSRPRGFARWSRGLALPPIFGFPVHPHMLRHACGFKLANDGVDTRSLQAYLGHRNIQHTVRYTELAPTRFKNFWHD